MTTISPNYVLRPTDTDTMPDDLLVFIGTIDITDDDIFCEICDLPIAFDTDYAETCTTPYDYNSAVIQHVACLPAGQILD